MGWEDHPGLSGFRRQLGALELRGFGGSCVPRDEAGEAWSSPSLQGGTWDPCPSLTHTGTEPTQLRPGSRQRVWILSLQNLKLSNPKPFGV